jgi:hypothetical protein
MSRRGLLWLAGLALVLIATHAVLASRLGSEDDTLIVDFMWLEVPLYLAAVAVVLFNPGAERSAEMRGPSKRAVVGILIVAAILRVMLVPIDPVSTDINRYIWDGRVQAAGINPYRYIPADPALKSLRDTDIYPEINRKDYARTIYPPLDQMIFYLVTRWDEDITVMKAAMVAFDALAIFALMRLLRLRNLPPTRILLYAWHPIPVWQFAGDGHVDAIAVASLCLALLAAQARRPALSGLALAGAFLSKFYPVLIASTLYRRWDWKLPLAALVATLVAYLPYLSVGKNVLGFLSGYSDEEGFRDGHGVYLWLLLKHFWPQAPQGLFALYMPLVVLALLGIAAVRFLKREDEGHDLFGAFLLATFFTVMTSPHYIWYVAWIVPFLCFYPSISVLWLTCAATFMNNLSWPNDVGGGSMVFLPFFALAAGELTMVWLRTRKERDGHAVVVEAG